MSLDPSTMTREQKELVAAAIMEKNRRFVRTGTPAAAIFFVRNYLYTFDPRPDAAPHDLPFDLYPYQEETIREMIIAIREGEDYFIEKSRDMGASWIVAAVIFYMWLFDDGFQALMGSRKEDFVDNGTLDSLFGKLDYFIRTIKDKQLLPKEYNHKKHRTYMKLVNPENQNVMKGESANKNFSRGGRYKVVFFDEFAFWPDARLSWTAAGDATKCRLAVTTPPDEPSFAKVVRFSGKIRVKTLHWRIHPKKSDDWYLGEKKRRTEEEVLHEIDISWEYSSVGKPYPEIQKVPFGEWPYDPTLPLYASIDIGLDAIAVGWYQPVRNSHFMTMVAAYEVTDKVIEWFLPFFGKDIDPEVVEKYNGYSDEDMEFIEMVKFWKKPIIYGDPSGNSRNVSNGISPYSIMRNNGLPVQVNTKENDWLPRRDAAKSILAKLRIHDTPQTRWFHECVSSSRYPKRDPDTSQSTSPIRLPVHDWTSHHRTQLEFFGVNYRPKKSDEEDRRREDSPIATLFY
jgi:hypothetical protein